MSVGYVPGNPSGPGPQNPPQDPYRGMLAQGQGPDQSGYMRALGAPLSQGNPSFGATGMPSNGQGPPPNFQQRLGRALTQMGQGGPQQGQGAPGQPGQQNPFMAALARLQAQRQQQGQPGGNPLAHMLQPGGGAQWGPNPMPQGMRGPAQMPPPQPQQPVQWGQMPPGGGRMTYPMDPSRGGNGP